jgi:cephalosporin hydroxylase
MAKKLAPRKRQEASMSTLIHRGIRRAFRKVRRLFNRPLHQAFFTDLVQNTDNFFNVRWLGQPILQNVLDLWTIQETLFEVKPELLIECGTNQGGSALFYAHLFDLMGKGRVVTVDIKSQHTLAHPRITFLIGSSVSPEILDQIRAMRDQAKGPAMVILDSDHTAAHVRQEAEAYAPFVTPGSFMLVQDSVIDVLPAFEANRPGPLPAIREFLASHPEFEVDHARCERFLISHHPLGWLRRR